MKQSQKSTSRNRLAGRVLGDKASADAFMDTQVRSHISRQVRAMRKARGWSQERLAKEARTEQPNISRVENLKYGSFTIGTLAAIARALDVGLSVRFVPFGDLIRREYSPEYVVEERTNDKLLKLYAAGSVPRKGTEAVPGGGYLRRHENVVGTVFPQERRFGSADTGGTGIWNQKASLVQADPKRNYDLRNSQSMSKAGN